MIYKDVKKFLLQKSILYYSHLGRIEFQRHLIPRNLPRTKYHCDLPAHILRGRQVANRSHPLNIQACPTSRAARQRWADGAIYMGDVSGVKINIVLLFLPPLLPGWLAVNNPVHNISRRPHKKIRRHRVLHHTILPLRGLLSVIHRKGLCRSYSDGNFLPWYKQLLRVGGGNLI